MTPPPFWSESERPMNKLSFEYRKHTGNSFFAPVTFYLPHTIVFQIETAANVIEELFKK